MRASVLGAAAAALFAGCVAGQPYKGAPAAAAWASPTTPWDAISRTAIGAVGQETPDSVLPFERPSGAATAASPRKVFIYYFPFFEISMDNYPIAEDHWTVDYLQRNGEHGKFAAQGGFTRERPLPVGPWPSPYWREINEAVDVLRARAMGADGFGVGIQQTGQGNTFDISEGVCFAAAHVAPGFQVFAEPDGAVLKTVPADAMAKTIAAYQTCPATLHLADGHALLAPFAPQNEPVDYWRDVLSRLRAANATADFIPVLLDPGHFGPLFAPISAAMSFWGFRDPATMVSLSSRSMMDALRHIDPAWMQPITPQDNRASVSVFWESRNTEAFRMAWMAAIQGQAQYAHLITWNDYSEETEVGPSSGTQFLFYDLSAYYTAWFKTGRPPRILRDAIYYSHRNQIFQPDHPPKPGDKPYKLLGDTPVANDIEMLAMLTAPATLEITIAGKSYRQNASAGLAAFRVPAAPGRPQFRILRGPATVVEKLSDWTIDANPDIATPLYFGGSSTRAFVPVPTGAH
jgi:hypothetical protein